MDSDDDSGLPHELEILWGSRGRSGRRARPGLSLERVVAAAVEIADSDGLAQVSMSRVAQRLGFTTMSLYRHVRSKEELLLLMQEAAVGVPPTEPDPAGGWRAGLERWARDQLAVFHRHPWLLQIPISGPPLAPSNLAWLEHALRVLRPTALDPGEKIGVIMLVSGYVRTEAQLSRDLTLAGAAASAEAAAEGGKPLSYGRKLAKLIDAERFPALLEVVESGVLDGPEGYTEQDFAFGLNRLLDGVDVLIRARAEGDT